MAEREQRKSTAYPMPSTNAIKRVAPDARKFGETLKILFKWKDSIYKMLWRHFILYYTIYVILSCLERFALDDKGKEIFREMASYCSSHSKSFYFAIMVAFFTSTAIQRHFQTLLTMPGTYTTTTTFIMSLKPNVPECRQMIATYARWQLLSWVLMFRVICKPLRRIFPDMMSLQRAGLLLPEEKLLLDQEEAIGNDAPRSLIVIEWMLMLLRECQEQKHYFYEPNVLKNVEVLMYYKKKCSNTLKSNLYNIPRPLVQAVIIGVYSLGVMTMLGRSSDGENTVFQVIIDFFPSLPSLRFFIYLSWLTFGRAAVNPFGEDETDIDIPKVVVSHIEDCKRLVALYDRKMIPVFQEASKRVNPTQATRHSTVLDVTDYCQTLDSQLTVTSLPEDEREVADH